jgi:HTH-type transcriptional regulator/antitoxin HigA
MTLRDPAETFPPGEFIREEMLARGWLDEDVYAKLGYDDVRCFAFDLAAYADDKSLILDEKTAADLSLVFGTSKEFWINIDRAWRGVVVGEITSPKEG